MENRELWTEEQLWEKVQKLAQSDALLHAGLQAHQYGLKQWRDRTFTLLMLIIAMAEEKQVLLKQLSELLANQPPPMVMNIPPDQLKESV